MLFSYMCTYTHRECVSMGVVSAQACRSFRDHLLHFQILRRLVKLKPTDFEAQSSLLWRQLHLQIQISNACPDTYNQTAYLQYKRTKFLFQTLKLQKLGLHIQRFYEEILFISMTYHFVLHTLT